MASLGDITIGPEAFLTSEFLVRAKQLKCLIHVCDGQHLIMPLWRRTKNRAISKSNASYSNHLLEKELVTGVAGKGFVGLTLFRV